MSKLIYISESEKREILTKHNSLSYSEFVFECDMTLDGRFLIFKDEIFDLRDNKLIGNVFESIENLKYLIQNTDIPNVFEKENSFLIEAKNLLKTNFIVEGIQDMNTLRKELLRKKTFFNDTKKRLQESSPSEILKEQGIMSFLGDAALSIARKVKEWLWSASGMMLDAFLVASGIGKSLQWIPWAIAFVLDVYQWSTNDYGSDTEFKESSTFWKILTLGFEVLGMLSAGPVALAAKRLFGPVKALKTEGQISQWVAKNPQAKQIITNISNLLGKVPERVNGISKMFSNKFPKLANWISGVIKGIGGWITKISEFLGRILKTTGRVLSAPGKVAANVGKRVQTAVGTSKNIGAGLQSAVNTGMVIGGINLASQGAQSYAQKKEDDEINTIINDTNADYSGLEP